MAHAIVIVAEGLTELAAETLKADMAFTAVNLQYALAAELDKIRNDRNFKYKLLNGIKRFSSRAQLTAGGLDVMLDMIASRAYVSKVTYSDAPAGALIIRWEIVPEYFEVKDVMLTAAVPMLPGFLKAKLAEAASPEKLAEKAEREIMDYYRPKSLSVRVEREVLA